MGQQLVLRTRPVHGTFCEAKQASLRSADEFQFHTMNKLEAQLAEPRACELRGTEIRRPNEVRHYGNNNNINNGPEPAIKMPI